MDHRRIAPYKRSWCVVGSRHVAEIAPAASGGLLRETTAGEESCTEGGDKTKIHELIIAEKLSRQWGEPQPTGEERARHQVRRWSVLHPQAADCRDGGGHRPEVQRHDLRPGLRDRWVFPGRARLHRQALSQP